MTMAVETKIQAMLPRMLDAARRDVRKRQASVSTEQLKDQLEARTAPRPFGEALTRPGLSVIAEYKRSSPTSGRISNAILEEQVVLYEENGAAALSVLTDTEHFGGSLADLRTARLTCDLPILRKDFVVDPYQLYEAAVNGADAVLLIVRVFDDDEVLGSMYELAGELDLDCLVEVHDASELERALDLGAEIIGINCRDLDSGEIHSSLTFDLMPDVPTGKTVVSASGIKTEAELRELERVGVDAVLIGSTFMAADDPGAIVRTFTGVSDSTREQPLP
jgi:indole-3-glycerol phosphate synthase